MSNRTNTKKRKSTTQNAAVHAGTKRAKKSRVGAAGGCLAKKSTSYATKVANVTRYIFGKTDPEKNKDKTIETLRRHNNISNARYVNTRKDLVVARSEIRRLEEEVLHTEDKLEAAKKKVTALKKNIQHLSNTLKRTNSDAAHHILRFGEENNKLRKEVIRLQEAASRKKAAERVARMLE